MIFVGRRAVRPSADWTRRAARAFAMEDLSKDSLGPPGARRGRRAPSAKRGA